MTTWKLGGEGGNSFPFDNVNDFVTGFVMNLDEVQQTDIDSGDPLFWDNGDKMMMNRVTLATELRDPTDPSDDGTRTVFLKGSKKPESESTLSAVLEAVKAATNGGVELGYRGKLTLQYVGDRPVPGRKFTAKRYKAWYEAPAMELDKPQGPPPGQQQQGPPPQQQQAGPPDHRGPTGPQNQWQPQAGPTPGLQQNQWQQPQQPQQGPPPQGQWNPAMQGNPGPAPQSAPPQGPGTQPGGNWPPPQGDAPAWAQEPPPNDPWATPQATQQAAAPESQQPPSQPTQQQPDAAQSMPNPTQQQIAGLEGLGIDPATVYGQGWQSRVVA